MPLLPHTTRQLSGNIPELTSSLQRIFIWDCLSVDALYVIIPFCNLQGFFQNFSEYF